MKFNNKDVHAIKLIKLNSAGEVLNASPVSKLIYNNQIVWEDEWNYYTLISGTTSKTQSSKHPGYYYFNGSTTLYNNLAIVSIVQTEDIENTINYNKNTGYTTFECYSKDSNSAISVMIIIYRYLKDIETNPTITYSISNKNSSSKTSLLSLSFDNKNTFPLYMDIKIYNNNNVLIYDKMNYVIANYTKTISDISLSGTSFKVNIRFYYNGYKDSFSNFDIKVF